MLDRLIRGVHVPTVGLGTFDLLGEECIRTVQAATEEGYRHFDTASKYGNEEQVGAGLAQSGLDREEFFITTKVWITDVGSSRIVDNVRHSLQRLGLDYVDLLLLHWPSPFFSVQESIESLSAAKTAGLTRQIGVSNFPPSMLVKALEFGDIFCNQVEFHPYLDQSALLRLAHQHEMLLTGYAPLAIGRVSEDPVLLKIGRHHRKTPAQIALRWLIDHPDVAVVPKTRSAPRLRENLDLWNFSLTEAETTSIAGLAQGLRIYDEEWVHDWEDNSRGSGPALRSATLS